MCIIAATPYKSSMQLISEIKETEWRTSMFHSFQRTNVTSRSMKVMKSPNASTIVENWKKNIENLNNKINEIHPRNVYLTTSFSRHSPYVILTYSSSQPSPHNITISRNISLSVWLTKSLFFFKNSLKFKFLRFCQNNTPKHSSNICSFYVPKENEIHQGKAVRTKQCT